MSALHLRFVPQKTCCACGVVKGAGAFSKATKHRDGLASRCRPCDNAQSLLWAAGNRDVARARTKAWMQNNPERAKRNDRAKYLANPAKAHARVRAFYKRNPDVLKAKHAERRAREACAAGSHTAAELTALRHDYAGLCGYCLSPAEHIDHVVPLARGGSNNIDNLLPACAPCNLSKGSKPLLVWLAGR